MHEAGRVGVRTTADTKEQQYVATRALLEEQRLKVFDRAVTTDRDGLKSQLDKLVLQLHNYSAVYSEPANIFSQIRRGWTGKCMGAQDDICMALQLAIYFRGRYLRQMSA